MKIYTNEPKLKRWAMLSHTASLGGLFLLMAGLVLPMFRPGLAILGQIMVIAGILVSMSGIYFANRWVRRPRPEDSLANTLKTLDDGYSLFCYTSLPARHILLMPNGILAFETINLAGEFSYQNGRWKEKMNLGRMLRYLLEEHLGDPSRTARLAETALKDQIHNTLGIPKSVPISSMVVFLHPLAQLEVRGAPVTVCKIDKLRKQVASKAPKMDPQTYEQIHSFLEKHTMDYQ